MSLDCKQPNGVDSRWALGDAEIEREPKWRNGRRAGLKIRSSQEGVGSSPTFGTNDLRRFDDGAIQLGRSLALPESRKAV